MTEQPNREVAVLNAALELRPEERAAYLDQACAGDPALRRQVEALLKAHEQAGGFLETPPAGFDFRRTNAANTPLTEKPGDRIGRYKLLQQIGEGGCGVVYMAEQEEPVRRRVALKVIKLGMDTKQVIARFEAERQALALMDHPNIAKIFDAGITDAPLPASGHPLPSSDEGRGQGEGSPLATRHSSLVTSAGRPYFVMELVRGIKITEFCDENKLSTQERLKLFIQVCQAIQHAHQKGVIHRDIKPSNILVTVNDGVPVPKVIDFGIAKATQGRLTDHTLFTAFEQFIGTPAYMSPEQAVMTSLDIDTRSDIYSLGVLLYELLTGRTPFDQTELLAAGLDEMRRTIREVKPVKPSTRLTQEITNTAKVGRVAPRAPLGESVSVGGAHGVTRPTSQLKELIHALRGDLDWIAMKCLEKDRTRRYETANGLAADIRRHLNCEPVIARPPSRLYEFQKTVRRHKFGFAAATVLITVLAVGVVLSTSQAIRLAREHRAATEKLFDSYVAQARARRRDNREGQRLESLEAVAKAAVIHSSLELRNEAIACLAMTDVRFANAHASPDPESECWDAHLELRACRLSGGRVSVRRVGDNREIAVLPSMGAEAQWFSGFSSGGRFLAVNYVNGRNVVWDVNQQQPAISDLPDGPLSVNFSADGQTFVAAAGDGQLRSYGLNPIHPLSSFPVNRRFHLLYLRPQGDLFAASEGQKSDLELRDLRDGALLRTLPHPSPVASLAWSSDGTDLAVGCENGRIFIWNALTGEKQSELEGHDDTVTSVGFSRSGWLLGSSSWDGQFRLWDVATGRILLTTAGWSYQVMFSADDRGIGYVQRGHETGSLELMPSLIFRRLSCRASPFRGSMSVDVSPDDRLVAAAFQGGVRIWADQQTEEPFFLPAAECYSAIFTPDGTNLITCGRRGVARWPMRRIPGATIDQLQIGPRQSIGNGDFNYAALSRDGSWLAAANAAADGVSVYQVRNPTNHFSLLSQPRISYPTISPDGRWVAAGNFKTSGVKVWEFDSRRVVCTLPTPSSAAVVFSPDNRWLAVSGVSFDLWEAGTWKRKYTIARNRPDLRAVSAFSPDTRTIALADGPGIVHLVAADSGEVLANLEAPRAANISFLRFSPDGSQLFALEWDQQVQVWDLRGLRSELAKLNLDWDAPPIPAESAGPGPAPKPLRISLAETVSP